MAENNGQVFTENQLAQETTSYVYEPLEEGNSSSLAQQVMNFLTRSHVMKPMFQTNQ